MTYSRAAEQAKDDRAAQRHDLIGRLFLFVFLPLCIFGIYKIVTAAAAPISLPAPAAAPASPVIDVHVQVIEPTRTPTPPVGTPTPTPGPCTNETIPGEVCVSTGELPPTSTPITPDCREGLATPGAACRPIPIVPTPTTLPDCPEPTGPTPTVYGSGRCTWPASS